MEKFQEKVFLHEARASFATGITRAQVAYGDVLESATDYEFHFQRLTDHLAHCEKSDIKRRALGQPNERTLEEDLERNQSRWFKELISMLLNLANFLKDREAATSRDELRYHTSSGTHTRKP